MIKKSDSKGVSLATTSMDGGSAGFAGATNRSVSILGQPPRRTSHKLAISHIVVLFDLFIFIQNFVILFLNFKKTRCY